MRPRLTYSNVVSTLCLFLLLAGGTAYALDGSNTVFSDDIVNGDVKVADIGQGAVATDEIANGQVKAADLGDGEVKTAEIANGQVLTADIGTGEVRSGNVANDNLTGGDISPNSLKGADIDEGTLDIGDAARAYGTVVSDFCAPPDTDCPVFDSKGVSSITRTDVGEYCVIAPDIDAEEVSAAVTVDWSGTDNPRGNASAMSHEGFECGPRLTGFRVFTERQPVTSSTTVGPAVPADDVGFTIVIP